MYILCSFFDSSFSQVEFSTGQPAPPANRQRKTAANSAASFRWKAARSHDQRGSVRPHHPAEPAQNSV